MIVNENKCKKKSYKKDSAIFLQRYDFRFK